MRGRDTEERNDFVSAAAFAAIGNETRLRILYALWDASGSPIPFTDLRKRVGVRDSSQFNYHLRQLADTFIEKTDAGYVLRFTGAEVIWAMLMGTYTETAHLDPFEMESPCLVCESPLRARYDDGMLFIECTSCGQNHEAAPVPATGLIDRTNEEILEAFDRVWRLGYDLMASGICWGCKGPWSPTVLESREDNPERMRYDMDTQPFDIGVKYECAHCTRYATLSPGMALPNHPAVVAFHHDHGIDLTDTPYWELDWCVTDRHTEVISTDPWLVRVTIPLDGEKLRATIDDELAVTEIGRVDAMTDAEADETA